MLPLFCLVAMLGLLLVLWSMGLLWRRFRAWRAAEEQAEERAEALLRELLSEEEYRQLGQLGYLEVRSRAQPGRRYRIPRHCGTGAGSGRRCADHAAMREIDGAGPRRRRGLDAQAHDRRE